MKMPMNTIVCHAGAMSARLNGPELRFAGVVIVHPRPSVGLRVPLTILPPMTAHAEAIHIPDKRANPSCALSHIIKGRPFGVGFECLAHSLQERNTLYD